MKYRNETRDTRDQIPHRCVSSYRRANSSWATDIRPSILLAALLLAGSILGSASVSAQLFPAQYELSDLLTGDGSEGFVLNGIDGTPPPNDVSGYAVSSVGDMNGDGIDDFVIGAPGGSPAGRQFAGEAYVMFGKNTRHAGNFPHEFELWDMAAGDGSEGFALNGVDPDDSVGFVVSAAGDVNHDGFDDLLLGVSDGAPAGRIGAGEAYVIFGHDTETFGDFPAEFELSSLMLANGGDGSLGFVLNGIDPADSAGQSVNGVGDVNGDGIDDIIIGAPGAGSVFFPDIGASYVIFGKTTATDGDFPAEIELSSLATGDGSTGFAIVGTGQSDQSGYSVSAAGDVDHDGVNDILIGAPTATNASAITAGEAYVVFGRDATTSGDFPPVFDLATLEAGDGSTGFVMQGIFPDDLTGDVVSNAGDMNGDGIDDLLVAAREADPAVVISAGKTYVVFGRDTALSGSFPAVFDLATLAAGDGSTGFVLNGNDMFDRAGRAAATPGDVNGDGLSDILIGATNGDPGGRSNAGETYVVYGRNTAIAGNFPAELALVSLAEGDGSHGFVINGIDPEDISGRAVSGAGDVNHDGVADMIIGAPWADPHSFYSGESYVVFGRADTDGDGVRNALDNCTQFANPDQRDTDGDGFGNYCDSDLNNDCVVNFTDLGMMKAVYFTADADADLNGDGAVNATDLGLLKSGFFAAPGPSGLTAFCDET